MPGAVDYERVVLGFKAHIRSKRSHGQDELLRVLADLEIESQIDGEQAHALSTPAASLLRLEERDRAATG